MQRSMKPLALLLLAPVATAVSVRGGARLPGAAVGAKVESATLMAHEVPSAAGLEDSLMALLLSGNTPELAAFVTQIQSLLDTQMKPQVRRNLVTQQTQVQRMYDQFATCTAALGTSQANVTAAGNRVLALSSQHQQCRQAQSRAFAADQACQGQLRSLISLRDSSCQALTTLEQKKNTDKDLCPPQGSETYGALATRLGQYFTSQFALWNSTKQQCDSATASVSAKQAECQGTAASLASQVTACDRLQDEMDSTSCNQRALGTASCAENDSCYQQALANYQSTVATARAQLSGMRTEWEAILRLTCLSGTFAVADTGRAAAITTCRDKDHTAEVNAALQLNITDAPAKASCIVPANTAGTPPYVQQHYAPLATLAPSAPAKTCTATCCVTAGQAERVTCTFTVDNIVRSLYYNNVDLLATVTPQSGLGDWPTAKTFSFNYVKGAYLAIAGQELDPTATCGWSGLAIVCSGSAATVTDPSRWQAIGSNVDVAANDPIRTGAGTGWTQPCTSTSPFYLDGVSASSYSKIWAGSNRFGFFRWRSP